MNFLEIPVYVSDTAESARLNFFGVIKFFAVQRWTMQADESLKLNDIFFFLLLKSRARAVLYLQFSEQTSKGFLNGIVCNTALKKPATNVPPATKWMS